MRLVVLQPGYLPWLGFFDQLYKSDIFVIYDDVQFDKNGWRNRNRIKTPQGPIWLTVPVLTKGQWPLMIKDVLIDNHTNWRRKHQQGIEQNYSKAPFYEKFTALFEELYAREWRFLLDLDMAFIYQLAEALGLQKRIELSSQLHIEGEQVERLVNICLHYRAAEYLTGDAAKDYLQEELFTQHGITVEYHNYQHPTYAQLHGTFLPQLSVVDLLLNHGPESLSILTGQSLIEAKP